MKAFFGQHSSTTATLNGNHHNDQLSAGTSVVATPRCDRDDLNAREDRLLRASNGIRDEAILPLLRAAGIAEDELHAAVMTRLRTVQYGRDHDGKIAKFLGVVRTGINGTTAARGGKVMSARMHAVSAPDLTSGWRQESRPARRVAGQLDMLDGVVLGRFLDEGVPEAEVLYTAAETYRCLQNIERGEELPEELSRWTWEILVRYGDKARTLFMTPAGGRMVRV